MEGLDWQTIQLPFAAGLNTKAHEHALEAPSLVTCKNVEFDEVGGLRLRKPFEALGTDIYPAGALTNVRKFARLGDELLCFTDTALYAWNDQLQKWVSKGTHLAVKTEEATRFGNTYDQVFADRAELDGLVVYTWLEVQSSTSSLCYLAAIDRVGNTVIAPTSFGVSRVRPRVVALDTKILVMWVETGNGLYATTIDPAAPAFTTAGANLLSSNQQAYDVVRDPAADQAVAVIRNAAGTSYTVIKVTAALAASSSTKVRTADGIVALSCSPSGNDRVQILRTSGNNVVGDLLVVSTLADVFTGTAIGGATTTINQLTGAHRSTADGGFYRCYVFWSAGETSSGASSFLSESNWIDTNNAVGAEATFLRNQGIASRAFNHDGRIFVWTVFAGESSGLTGTTLGIRGQMQNAYFLHRDDGEWVAKAAWSNAGGFTYTSGHLPGVVARQFETKKYAWCGVERQVITIGGSDRSSYGARAPREILFEFDSNDARRTVQLGRTLYVTGSIVQQYDGESLVEVGFAQYPWALAVGASGAGVNALPDGKYSYKATLRWDNAKGETERSTTATGVQITVTNPTTIQQWSEQAFHVTKKKGSRRVCAVELWRTKVNPGVGFPFYLATSKDPATVGSGSANQYVPNSPGGTGVGVGDNMLDATLELQEQNPENSGTLPRLAPPSATIIAANDTRLFLAGIPGEPYRIWYSLRRGDNEIPAFHPACTVSLPSHTGPITALAFLNETLVAFTSNAIYVLEGDGFDNLGGGSNYGPPRLISSDTGAWKRSDIAVVALTPVGLVFKARKGFYRLGRGWELEYIGAPVEAFNDDDLVAITVHEYQHQIRFLTDGRMLVWDHLVNQWSEWDQANGRDLLVLDGIAMLLDTAPKQQTSDFTLVTYSMDIETSWIKLNGLQGFGKLRWFEVLGEWKADHQQRIRVARDYQSAYFDDKTISVTTNPTQVRHGPSQKRVEAVKVRITILNTLGGTPAYDAVTLTGLSLEVGIKRGLYRRLPASQKQ